LAFTQPVYFVFYLAIWLQVKYTELQ